MPRFRERGDQRGGDIGDEHSRTEGHQPPSFQSKNAGYMIV